MPGKAPGEVVSGWSANPRLRMPGTVHTHNERLVVADPLSASELRQRDCTAAYCAGKGDAALAKRVVKGWAAPLRTATAVDLKLQPAHLLRAQLCADR